MSIGKTAQTLLIIQGLLAWPALAAAGSGEQHGHQPPGPPPGMMAACKGKTPGARAILVTPDGDKLSGSCQLMFRPDTGGPAADGDRGARP